MVAAACPRLRVAFRIHFITVVALGGAGLAFAVVMAAEPMHVMHLSHVLGDSRFWVLVGMVLAAEIWPIGYAGRSGLQSLSGAATLSVAALLIWGLSVALLLRVLGVSVAHVSRRRTPAESLFVTACAALGLTVGWAVLHALHVHTDYGALLAWQGSSLAKLPLVLLAMFACGVGPVVVASSLQARERLEGAVRRTLAYEMPVGFALVLVAVPVAILIHQMSGLVMLLFAIPFTAIYVNAALRIRGES